MNPMPKKKWDAFLCHATEDKPDFVDPLYQELTRLGLAIWYDKFEIKVGQSLRGKVEEGLSRSRFGIVVFSPDFFRKSWTREELDGLFTLQLEKAGRSRILPVWHKVTKADVIAHSPILAGKLGLKSADGVKLVARRLAEIIKPKVFHVAHTQKRVKDAATSLIEQLSEIERGLDAHVTLNSAIKPTLDELSAAAKPGIVASATDRFNVCSLQRIKSFLSGVFRLAIQQGYYDGPNPIRETSIPVARRSDETYAYSLTEELTMIQAVPEPAATMLAVAAFTGARRGEIRGMSWENYRNGELLIDCSIWNGIATEPKSRKSKAPIPIIGWLAAKLAEHRKLVGNPTSGPVFRNEAGKAMDPNNLLGRVILPALNVCGICSKPEAEHDAEPNHKYERNTVLPKWRGWHAFRRGLATNLHQMGVDDLTIQAILRHSNVSITQKCYIKTASAETKTAMQKVQSALTDTNVTPKQPIPVNRVVQ